MQVIFSFCIASWHLLLEVRMHLVPQAGGCCSTSAAWYMSELFEEGL